MSFSTLRISPLTVLDRMVHTGDPEDTSSEESGVAVAPSPPPQSPTSPSYVSIHSSPMFRDILDQLMSDMRKDMQAQHEEVQRRRASAPIPRMLPKEKEASEVGHRNLSGSGRCRVRPESRFLTGNTGKEGRGHLGIGRDLSADITSRDTSDSEWGGAKRRRTWPLRPPDRRKLVEDWVDLTDGGAGDGSDTLGENRRERANHIRHMSVHSRVVRGMPARLPLAAITRSDASADADADE